MKTSELIKLLEESLKENGDVKVIFSHSKMDMQFQIHDAGLFVNKDHLINNYEEDVIWIEGR